MEPSEGEKPKNNYSYYWDTKYDQWRHESLRDIPKQTPKDKKEKE